MAQKLFLFFKKAQLFASQKWVFVSLSILDLVICFLVILNKNIIFGLIFLLINITFIILCDSKKMMYIIFLLYPLARVLKMPGIDTSFVTILLPFIYAKLVIKCFKEKFKVLNYSKLLSLSLFLLYFLITLTVSLINYNGFKINALFSYYLYLFLPIAFFVFTNKKDAINGANSMIIISISFLTGIIYTLVFHYIIPNGDVLLKMSGVNVFDMGTYGLRFSPLTDDPNYGTSLIVLVSALFLSHKKTKKEKIIGYPVVFVNLIISILSLSKMYFLCLIVVFSALVLKIIRKYRNPLLTITLSIAVISVFIVFFGTSFGQSLIVRTIGTRDGVDLNRITSGRTDIFGEYSSYILNNPIVVIFGKGPVYSDLSIFSTGEHNTFTKAIYGNGLVGVTIMLVILFLMLKGRQDRVNVMPNNLMFYAFLICLFICFMSLGITPSTVFPIVVLTAQYTDLRSDSSFNEAPTEKLKGMVLDI